MMRSMWLISLARAAETDVCVEHGNAGAPVVVEGMPDIQPSGIAASRAQAGRFYTHDDAKGEAKLHVFERTSDGATYVGALAVAGATNVDWEDVAAAACPPSIDAEDCVWIGDIGDNDGVRASIDVWVIEDSMMAGAATARCKLAYEDGERFDAEALLVSPDGTIRVVTKEKDGEAKIYKADRPACDGETTDTLVREAELRPGEPITGAAMNASGTAAILRGGTGAWLWTGCEKDWEAPATPVELGVQPQGEGVTFLEDGSIVSSSEGEPARIWETPCVRTEAIEECPKACGCDGAGAGLLLLAPLAWARRGRRSGAGGRDPT